jgi:hypothetical protein
MMMVRDKYKGGGNDQRVYEIEKGRPLDILEIKESCEIIKRIETIQTNIYPFQQKLSF